MSQQAGGSAPEPDQNAPAAFPVADDGFGGLANDGGTTRFLARMLTVTPFLDLHERAGGESKSRYRLCVSLDLLLRLVVVALIVAIAGCVAWKTLAPLPYRQSH